jgi:hypothetical protein
MALLVIRALEKKVWAAVVDPTERDQVRRLQKEHMAATII